MDCLTILAQAGGNGNAEEAASSGEIVPIQWFWEQITALEWLQALTFISFGVVCVFYGWRVFKILVVINFGLLGLAVGMQLTAKMTDMSHQLTGAPTMNPTAFAMVSSLANMRSSPNMDMR